MYVLKNYYLISLLSTNKVMNLNSYRPGFVSQQNACGINLNKGIS